MVSAWRRAEQRIQCAWEKSHRTSKICARKHPSTFAAESLSKARSPNEVAGEQDIRVLARVSLVMVCLGAMAWTHFFSTTRGQHEPQATRSL